MQPKGHWENLIYGHRKAEYTKPYWIKRWLMRMRDGTVWVDYAERDAAEQHDAKHTVIEDE